jgi:hypothetical protein
MTAFAKTLWPLVVVGLVVSSNLASAGAAPNDEVALVAGLLRGRIPDQKLTKGLNEHLARSGLMVANDAGLSSAERVCTDADCLDAIGARTGAQIILTGELQQNSPSTVFITMALFDRLRRAPFEVKDVCDQCTPETLTGQLADMADKLVKQCRAGRQNTSSPLPPPGPAVPTVPLIGSNGNGNQPPGNGTNTPKGVERGFFANWSSQRKTALGIFGAVFGASLITGIALHATDKQYTSLPCETTSGKCRLDNVGLYGTSYVLAGVSLIGAAITIFWPTSEARSSETRSSEVK